MNSNDLQSLNEAYGQVQQLDEATLTGGRLGFEIGRGRRGLTFGVDTDKGSVDASVGSQQVGGQTDPKASIDSALDRLGDAHVGGKPGNPTTAAKPTPVRNVPYGSVRANFNTSVGSAPKPSVNSTSPTPVRPKTPDVKRPAEVKTPDVRRPVEMDKGPDMVRKPESFDKPKFEDPRRKMMMGGVDMGRGMREQLAYEYLFNYLINEGYASTEEAADKIILNMSESWFENIMELNRYEKETGKDYKTGKEVTRGGTMGGDDTHSKVMRHMHKVMGAGRMGAGGPIQPRGKKKDKGGPTPGPVETPAKKVAKRRADAQRAQDMMHSARD